MSDSAFALVALGLKLDLGLLQRKPQTIKIILNDGTCSGAIATLELCRQHSCILLKICGDCTTNTAKDFNIFSLKHLNR